MSVALILAALTGLAAAQASLRAQIDTRLAAYATAQISADLHASSLLTALLEDAAELAFAEIDLPLGDRLCTSRGGCPAGFPRLQAVYGRLPAALDATLALVELDWNAAVALPEGHASGHLSYSQRVIEGRVLLNGAARAELAAAIVVKVEADGGGT